MLGFFRRRMKTILWILVGFVIVAFVPWGAGVRYFRGEKAPRTAGEIFGRSVPLAEFDDAFRAISLTSYLRGRRLERAEINRMAWDRLLMLAEARRLGISVPDRELAETIRRQFTRGGRFDQQLYETSLGLAQISPSTYERWVRESLMISRLFDTVRATAWLPDPEIERQLRERREEYVIAYRLVDTGRMEKKIKISESEIEDYYEKNRDMFKTSPMVNARYVLIEWGKKIKMPQAGEDDIKRYYEEHQEEFSHGERLRARHILFTLKGGEEKALRKARRVLEKLRKGADFNRLARKYSQDEKTKSSGGALGFIERGDMPRSFTEKAFAMKEAELSEPVRTDRGYHIIMVDEIQPAGIKSLDEVREEIISKIEMERKARAEEEAKREAYSRAVDVSLALVDSPDLEKVAREFSLDTKETGPFARPDGVPGLGYAREFNDAAFETEPGAFSDIVEVRGKGYAIIVPEQRIEEKVKPLAEVRREIVEKLREAKAAEKAGVIAGEERARVVARMREGDTDFMSACSALSLPVVESDPFSEGGPIKGLGRAPGISKVLPGLESGDVSPVCGTPKGPCFFTVLKREEPAEEQIEKELKTYRRRALLVEAGKLSGEWNRRLRERAGMVDYISEWKAPGE